MKLKIVENLSKKFTKTASVEMKKEVKKTAIDLIPGLIAFAGFVASILLFKGLDGDSDVDVKPMKTVSHTTVNNYFFNDVSDDMILKILNDIDE